MSQRKVLANNACNDVTPRVHFAIIGARSQGTTMKTIVTIFAVLAVLTIAAVGCLYIFGVRDFDQSVSLLVKAVAALVLLGGCTALITVLMGNKESSDSRE